MSRIRLFDSQLDLFHPYNYDIKGAIDNIDLQSHLKYYITGLAGIKPLQDHGVVGVELTHNPNNLYYKIPPLIFTNSVTPELWDNIKTTVVVLYDAAYRAEDMTFSYNYTIYNNDNKNNSLVPLSEIKLGTHKSNICIQSFADWKLYFELHGHIMMRDFDDEGNYINNYEKLSI